MNPCPYLVSPAARAAAPPLRGSALAMLLGFVSVALPQLSAQSPAVGDASAVVSHSSGLAADGNGGLRGIGADYEVQFGANGLRFEPALGHAVAATQHLALVPAAVGRSGVPAAALPSFAAPRQRERTAYYEHAPGVTERYEVTPEHVALSWLFDARPRGSGDLVVRYAVDTMLPAPVRGDDGGLTFGIPEVGGVLIGGVTGVDANGVEAVGELRWQPGVLELSLPGGFVDAASYPLVLDPAIGTALPIAAASSEIEPDVAYDASTGLFLVVWLRDFSASQKTIRGQYVSTGGTLHGPVFSVTTSGVARRPRVANLATRDRFGVAWTESGGGTYTVKFAAVTAGHNATTHSLTIASALSDVFLDVDIGCDTQAPIGSTRGFVVVYEDNAVNRIQARRIYFSSNDQLVAPAAIAVFSDTGGIGSSYTQPAISRAGASSSDLLVTARRFSGIGPTRGVYARTIASDTGALGPSTSLLSSNTLDVLVPDVDGYDGRWVVAWQQNTLGSTDRAITCRPVTLGAAGSLTLGASTTFGGLVANQWTLPALAFSPGRVWFGYRQQATFGTTVQVSALDSAGCSYCGDDVFAESVSGSALVRIVAATATSGGATDVETTLAVWSAGTGVRAQRLRNHGLGGSVVSLAGGCGNGGTPAFSHAPGIGSSGLVCALSGLPPTAVATVFNFSAPAVGLPCGSCAWTPFSVTLTPPIVAGAARAEFPIPCLTTLIGSQFETQWTTIDLTQAPCSLLPGFVLSDRLLMTIGN